MTGGLLQLVTQGAEDTFITNEPQITFFKTVYRRHTNFSRQEFDTSFSTTLDFGKESKCRIKRYGDLLHRLFLVIQLPLIDIRFAFLTIKEVKNVLLNNEIVWETDRTDNEQFDESAYEEVVVVINNKILELEKEIDIFTQIIPLLEPGAPCSAETYLSTVTGATNGNVNGYFNFVINKLIEYDQYDIQYKFVDAHLLDRVPPLLLANSVTVQETVFNEFAKFVTGQTTFDPVSFNDENLFFLYNTETANYNIGSSVDQLSSDTVFKTGISNTYGDIPYNDYDANKIFNKILEENNININSNFDVQVVRDILLENIRFGLIKNPKLLEKVYEALENDFKFIFYRLFKRQGSNVFDKTADFNNVSTLQSLDPEFNDNFTEDFVLDPEFGESASVSHPYSNFVNDSVTEFHNSNRSLFRDERFRDYFDDIPMWSRINVGTPGNDNIDDFENLCSTAITAVFGPTTPSSMFRMYFLNYIPLLAANDIPIAVQRIVDQRIASGDSNSSNVAAFKTTLLTFLESVKTDVITNLLDLICSKADFFTTGKISDGFRNVAGDNGDIIMYAIVRNESQYEENDLSVTVNKGYITYNGVNLLFPEYVIVRYIEALESFTATGYPEEETLLKDTVRVFATPTSEIPSHTLYVNNNRNIREDIQINNSPELIEAESPANSFLPTLSEAISSIWYNILTNTVKNYNSLFDSKLLSKTVFDETLGVEMKTYLDFISSTYFGVSNSNPQPVNYFFDTVQSELPTTETGGIGVYLSDKITKLQAQIKKYDTNRPLLDMINLIVPKTNFYFEKYDIILDEIIDNSVEIDTIVVDGTVKLLYDHEGHNTISDPVLLIKDTLINSTDPSIAQNNAMDIVEIINSKFNDFTTLTTNPFNATSEPNKYIVWNQFWLPNKSFSSTEEDDKYEFLFSFITPQELFKQLPNIENNYNNFLSESDVYRFMRDTVVLKSIFSELFDTKGDNVTDTNQNMSDFFTNGVADKNSKLLNIKGDDNTLSLAEQLENALRGGTPASFAWIKRLGHYIVDSVKIKIGDQEIDRHTGEWLELRHQLTMNDSKERGYNMLIGDIDELTTFDAIQKDTYELIVPLQFWFCQHIGSSIPLVGLQHTTVDVYVKLQEFNKVSYFDSFTKFAKTPRLKCKMLTEYAYVESDERDRLAKSNIEYLIETLQIHKGATITGKTDIMRERLFLHNPCKELIWVLQSMNEIDGSRANGERRWNVYSVTDSNGQIVNPTESTKIEFSSRDRELFKEQNYYNYVQPYQHHNHTPSVGVNMYSFSLKPEDFQPSGQVNMSELDDTAVTFKLVDSVAEQLLSTKTVCRFTVYATSYNVLKICSGMSGLLFFYS